MVTWTEAAECDDTMIDRDGSRLRRLRLGFVLGVALVAGCTTINNTAPKVEETPGVERWICGDFYDGCTIFSTDCVKLTANLNNGTGEVNFSRFSERTEFRIDGIERRWNWCMADDYSYNCAFIISVDGTGKYYNFRGSDGAATPRDLFKCSQR